MHSTNNALIAHAERLLKSERQQFLQRHPTSVRLAEEARKHFLYGVPMHWMNDWGTPTPLFVREARGAHFTCAAHHKKRNGKTGESQRKTGHNRHQDGHACIHQHREYQASMVGKPAHEVLQ